MTAQEQEVLTELTSRDGDGTQDRRVIRRASQLCLRAEPHTERSPCPAHLAEARRQLLASQD